MPFASGRGKAMRLYYAKNHIKDQDETLLRASQKSLVTWRSTSELQAGK